MGVDRAPLVDRVRAALAGDASLREVGMFGSLAFMVDGQMLVAVGRSDTLLVRVDPRRTGELLARSGVGPAEMGAGRPMGPGWLHVAAGAVAAGDDLSFWITVARERTGP
jgi:hypothetical protein